MDSPSKKVQFLLRVEGDILSTLRGLAQENCVSTSQLLRDILREYVERLAESPPPPQVVKEKGDQWWN
tara:strand:- start:617 stop:820 length:204 start_codon:yes stop_codon:yes gene_type:complete